MVLSGSPRAGKGPSLTLDGTALTPSRLMRNLGVFLELQLLLGEQVGPGSLCRVLPVVPVLSFPRLEGLSDSRSCLVTLGLEYCYML